MSHHPTQLIDSLPEIRGQYIHNASLSKLCRIGVGGDVDVLYCPKDVEDLCFFLKNRPKDVPIFIVGLGSNIVFRDKGLRGIMIKFGDEFDYIKQQPLNSTIEDNKEFIITVGCAATDASMSSFAMRHDIGGLEFLSGVPGVIGGAIAMNAGCYGNEVANMLISATAVNYNGEVQTFAVGDIGYRYRGNNLCNDWIFVEGEFRGYLANIDNIKAKMLDMAQRRQSTQPINAKTFGCTFKNPSENEPAWRFIHTAGCSGMYVGGASISDVHCNFIINDGSATSEDIENLIEEVRKAVLKKCGVVLELEVIIIGER